MRYAALGLIMIRAVGVLAVQGNNCIAEAGVTTLGVSKLTRIARW